MLKSVAYPGPTDPRESHHPYSSTKRYSNGPPICGYPLGLALPMLHFSVRSSFLKELILLRMLQYKGTWLGGREPCSLFVAHSATLDKPFPLYGPLDPHQENERFRPNNHRGLFHQN